MENVFAKYEGISVCWIEKCTFISEIVAMAQVMTTDDLLTLRNVLALRRRALLDRLATDTSGIIEPAYVSLLADTHTAIAAVDAELVEMEGGA